MTTGTAFQDAKQHECQILVKPFLSHVVVMLEKPKSVLPKTEGMS